MSSADATDCAQRTESDIEAVHRACEPEEGSRIVSCAHTLIKLAAAHFPSPIVAEKPEEARRACLIRFLRQMRRLHPCQTHVAGNHLICAGPFYQPVPRRHLALPGWFPSAGSSCGFPASRPRGAAETMRISLRGCEISTGVRVTGRICPARKRCAVKKLDGSSMLEKDAASCW